MERWKWPRKLLEGLIPAVEMARSEVGGVANEGTMDRSGDATGFG
jgi:hypothetical protein